MKRSGKLRWTTGRTMETLFFLSVAAICFSVAAMFISGFFAREKEKTEKEFEHKSEEMGQLVCNKVFYISLKHLALEDRGEFRFRLHRMLNGISSDKYFFIVDRELPRMFMKDFMPKYAFGVAFADRPRGSLTTDEAEQIARKNSEYNWALKLEERWKELFAIHAIGAENRKELEALKAEFEARRAELENMLKQDPPE